MQLRYEHPWYISFIMCIHLKIITACGVMTLKSLSIAPSILGSINLLGPISLNMKLHPLEELNQNWILGRSYMILNTADLDIVVYLMIELIYYNLVIL